MKKNTKKEAISIPSIFTDKEHKQFTREEIQEMIRWCIIPDPKPGGRPLSKRQRNQNAMHEQLAQYFDAHFDSLEFPLPMPVFRGGKLVLEGNDF